MTDALDRLLEQYLGLESMEATENLLELCGAGINEQALPLLKERVLEEEAQISFWQAHGYVRLYEKSKQLVDALQPLITALERMKQEKGENKR